jgi:hypothetical protein
MDETCDTRGRVKKCKQNIGRDTSKEETLEDLDVDGKITLEWNIKINITEIEWEGGGFGSGTHPASYPMGTRGSFLGVKRPGREADHSTPSSTEVKEFVEVGWMHLNLDRDQWLALVNTVYYLTS